MDYNMVKLPATKKEIRLFNKKEATEYLEWYVSEIENRVAILKEYAENDGCICEFDYSVESLIDLWMWYETKIKVEKKTVQELEDEYNKIPEWLHNEVSEIKISFDTYKIAWDISVYFGEVLVRNNIELHYGFFSKPKKRQSLNEPVVCGFKNDMDLNPRVLVNTCTHKSMTQIDAKRLFDLYYIWQEFI